MPANRRPHHPRQIEHHGVERDGVAQIFLAHHLHRHGLADRHVEGIDQPLEQRQQHHHPDLDQMSQGQHRQRRGLRHRGALRHQQHAAALKAVGDHAAKGREEEHRHLAAETHQPQHQRRMGQLPHQPTLGHIGDPGPHQRGELAGKEQPVIAMPEHGEEGEGAAVLCLLRRQYFRRRGRDQRARGHVFGQDSVNGADGHGASLEQLRARARPGCGHQPCARRSYCVILMAISPRRETMATSVSAPRRRRRRLTLASPSVRSLMAISSRNLGSCGLCEADFASGIIQREPQTGLQQREGHDAGPGLGRTGHGIQRRRGAAAARKAAEQFGKAHHLHMGGRVEQALEYLAPRRA